MSDDATEAPSGWRDRPLLPGGWVSTELLGRGVRTLGAAAEHLRALPYGRGTSRAFSAPLLDGRGTCSTKHAAFKELALEQGFDDVALVLVMTALAPPVGPAVAAAAAAHGVPVIIDAHCRVDVAGEPVDLTFPDDEPPLRPGEELSQVHIAPDDVIEEKPRRHRAFVSEYAAAHGLSAEALWAAREAFIAALASPAGVP